MTLGGILVGVVGGWLLGTSRTWWGGLGMAACWLTAWFLCFCVVGMFGRIMGWKDSASGNDRGPMG